MSDIVVTQLTNAFDATGVKFHNRAQALEEFKDGRHIEHTEEGAFTTYDGERLTLADALLRFAYDNRHPDLIDARTLPRSGAGTARPGTDHKGNYPTVADKTKFIRENGVDAWSALPLSGASSNEVKTREDWLKLPRAEKVRRIAAEGRNPFTTLPSRPTGQSAGCFINHAALAKEKAIRAGGR